MKSPRILISRLSHIGDCVLTLPLLTALRREYPDAYIAWAVEKPSDQLLRSQPGLDEIILIPKGWIGKPRAWGAILRDLRSREFEIAIDPQGITKSALLSYLSGARTRIGIRGRWGRELAPLLNNFNVRQQRDHLVDRSLELLGPFEMDESRADFGFSLEPDAVDAMRQFLANSRVSRRFAVINPGASWASKRWETGRFAEVANYLAENYELPSLITWAGPAEQAMANELRDQAPKASILAPPTSLNELAAILSMAEFFIGCDTGPMHISTAVGTPCIALYGPTLPSESGAYGAGHLHIQKWHQDGTCRERRSADNLAMQDISAEDVQTACDRMIQQLEDGRRAA
ncbi:MAG: glycosyltransferase family 9 protein [Mariniblastus sp.]|nr:glycosyltransferase family 9 protein [Mariniblastus sp.]